MLVLLVVTGTAVDAAGGRDQTNERQQVVATTPSSSTSAQTLSEANVPTESAPVTSTAPTSAPAASVAPGSVSALDLLDFVIVENEHQEGYNRDLFGYPADLDGDGCDTRLEVLVRDSAAELGETSCSFIAGPWYSAYDDTGWSDPDQIEIDHVVALKEAWDSGAWAWDHARQIAFGNDLDDPRTLRVTNPEVNNSKADSDPSNWIPNDDHVCTYLADWIAIKVRWSLSMDQSEHGRIGNLLEQRCPDQLVAPWPETPPPAPPPVTVPTTAPPVVMAPPVTPAPTTTIGIQPVLPPVVNTNCDPSYPDVCIPPAPPDLDCGDIPFRRFTVLPPDPHGFDGTDDDGIGCESD